jgi:hypothetical protein
VLPTPARRQRGVLVAEPGDVAQFGAELRVGQRAGRCHPLAGGIGLVAHGGELRVALAGILEQRFDPLSRC